MSAQSVFYETQDLPMNVLTLVDDAFYEFVEQRLGLYQSFLLKIQQINSVPCFLLTDNPCQVLQLNISDKDLTDLKTKICFPLSDGTFMVKPGVKTGFMCLRDLLLKKTEEKLKLSRNAKPLLVTNAPFNISLSEQPSPPTATVAPQTRTVTPETQAAIPSSHSTQMTAIVEHRKYFLNLLTTWCSNHKNEFMSDTFDLKEGKDFTLNISHNQNNDIQANVKCCCGQLSTLTIKEGKIQLSNFQKHLRSSNCSHTKAIKKMNENQRKTIVQHSNDISSSPTDITSTSPTSIQSRSQILVSTSPGASSSSSSPSANTQTIISQSSRKRGQPSSYSSSQKKKRSHV